MYYLCLNEKLGIADFQVDNLLNKRSEVAFTKIRRKIKWTENGIELSFTHNCHLEHKIYVQMRVLRELELQL